MLLSHLGQRRTLFASLNELPLKQRLGIAYDSRRGTWNISQAQRMRFNMLTCQQRYYWQRREGLRQEAVAWLSLKLNRSWKFMHFLLVFIFFQCVSWVCPRYDISPRAGKRVHLSPLYPKLQLILGGFIPCRRIFMFLCECATVQWSKDRAWWCAVFSMPIIPRKRKARIFLNFSWPFSSIAKTVVFQEAGTDFHFVYSA